MVEVEKVVRDLHMLYETITMAKFYRLLTGETTTKETQVDFSVDKK